MKSSRWKRIAAEMNGTVGAAPRSLKCSWWPQSWHHVARGFYSLLAFWSFKKWFRPQTVIRATPHYWKQWFAHYAKYNSHAIRTPGNKIQLYKLDSDPEILMRVTECGPKKIHSLKIKFVLCACLFVTHSLSSAYFSYLNRFTSF